MSAAFRQLLRTITPSAVLRYTLDSVGICCAVTLFWEHFYTIQQSEGPSMYPTLNVRGDWLLTSRRYEHGKDIRVGDVVRYHHPSFLGVNGAKRVLGLPGDFVCKDPAFSTDVGAENEMIQVPEGHVFVVGDNLPWSRDSRNYGPLPMGLINGKIVARVWPPSKMQWVQNSLEPVDIQESA
ncbi:putative mitochondrial inner membrane protease subunit 1 [Talaromyces proteolyticus]|uniref:Mitochondrial inner membrane protease subunit 1 n=1 Tax=Talaromyces proteolyticus TaxID=1131652 RepID=A0AAD4Q198_9EURO|nr:putative mitochondrial inner membrane protease subunit 1 [Talaromyces proteolyticus]KAH8705400.1 putative mitochondrial inner membrane protease subunit 1 [Talaromyces proteolyticus]